MEGTQRSEAVVIPLQWEVFVTKREGIVRDLPPGKEQWMWVPTSATLIFGQRDAVPVNGAYIAEFDSGGNFQLSSSGVLAGLSGGPSAEVKVSFSIPVSGPVNTPMTV
jgi:hypothetical protein